MSIEENTCCFLHVSECLSFPVSTLYCLQDDVYSSVRHDQILNYHLYSKKQFSAVFFAHSVRKGLHLMHFQTHLSNLRKGSTLGTGAPEGKENQSIWFDDFAVNTLHQAARSCNQSLEMATPCQRDLLRPLWSLVGDSVQSSLHIVVACESQTLEEVMNVLPDYLHHACKKSRFQHSSSKFRSVRPWAAQVYIRVHHLPSLGRAGP